MLIFQLTLMLIRDRMRFMPSLSEYFLELCMQPQPTLSQQEYKNDKRQI